VAERTPLRDPEGWTKKIEADSGKRRGMAAGARAALRGAENGRRPASRRWRFPSGRRAARPGSRGRPAEGGGAVPAPPAFAPRPVGGGRRDEGSGATVARLGPRMGRYDNRASSSAVASSSQAAASSSADGAIGRASRRMPTCPYRTFRSATARTPRRCRPGPRAVLGRKSVTSRSARRPSCCSVRRGAGRARRGARQR
jgi:hypothetical protein